MAGQELIIVSETGLQFDKNDIAAIAVAEAEKKMRMNIKKLRIRMTETEDAISHVQDEIKTLGIETIDLKTKNRIKVIKTGLKATKIKNLVVEIESSITTVALNEISADYSINSYTIRIGIWDKDTKYFSGKNIAIETDCLVATQLQRTAMKKYQTLNEQHKQLTSDSLDWRRKLGDIAAMERQIKAALAKRQIESSKGGKAIIESLLKNFENDLQLLGE